MDSQTKKIYFLIQQCITTRKVRFKKHDLLESESLLATGVLKTIEGVPDEVELNKNSVLFNKALLIIAEEKLGRGVPQDIVEAFGFVDGFQEKLKEENGIAKNVVNAYDELIKGLKAYVLFRLKADGVNIKEYYINELKPRGKRPNEMFLFEQHLYDFLMYADFSVDEIWQICSHTLASDDAFYVNEFAREVPSCNFELAKDLYHLASSADQPENTFFVSNLLTGLQNNGLEGVFEKAFDLYPKHPQQSYQVLVSLKKLSEKQNQKLYEHVLADSSENLTGHKTQALCKLIGDPDVSDELRKKCFDLIIEYLKSATKDVATSAFRTMNFSLKGHEAEKYQMLHIYLDNTKNISVLDDFFYRFENPEYLFHLIKMSYRAGWRRGSIHKFENAIFHFWNKDATKTESHILELFKPEDKFGMLPVEIIMTGRFGALPIDLLKLKTEQEQAKAIDSITLFPHSYDRWLPIILPLRDSAFSKVVAFLQIKLTELILEAYHNSLYKDIKKMLNQSKNDKAFLKPLKAALKKYKESVSEKETINDLNPYENERELMNLYYGLEHEKKTKTINEINENPTGLLAAIGNRTIIARGNSWKQELEEHVTPLGKVETSVVLDARLFKNPDLHEFILNTYDKK